jgi:signal transduction histidine kinase
VSLATGYRATIADIAHELRTPVAVMQGRLEGMLDGVYPADEKHMGQVVEQTRMLARLVEDLRTSAHAESGTLSLHREPTDPAMLIEDVAAASHPEADRRGVRIIPEQDLPHVFERFYKSPDSQGSGLGLSIAKSLAEAHGGTIAAANKPGGGTLVSLVLPVS